MCGIAGIVSKNKSTSEMEFITHEMLGKISHRGPDDKGVWIDEDSGVSLGHARLSIIDLSHAGHQPMISHDGNGVLVYNGEIYSKNELNDLMGNSVKYKSHTDTEVMLEAFSRIGIEKSVDNLIGMFAFAYYDKKEQKITLVRDRIGIKPIYWTKYHDGIAFGSEVKTIESIKDLDLKICSKSVAAMTRFGYVPNPQSIYENVYKLSPGHMLVFDLKTSSIEITKYWDATKYAIESQKKQFASKQQSFEKIEYLIEDSVKRRTVADVPFGSFLSGGVDSSLVTAIAQKHTNGNLNTFSVGFEDKKFDESSYAIEVAKTLGTKHHNFIMKESDMLDIVTKISSVYDEPFADSSQIPTYFLSKMSREHVTVALSGDGGDELFGGYERYIKGNQIWRGLDNMPLPDTLGSIIEKVPAKRWDFFSKIIPKSKRPISLGERAHRLAYLMQSKSSSEFYKKLIEQWSNHEKILLKNEKYEDSHDYYHNLESYEFNDDIKGVIENMQLVDTKTYLVDDILTKVDRASMAHSLEARVPLLDHRLFEAAWKVPMNMKVHKGSGKIILKKILEQYIPKKLINRPKKGFGIPLGDWIRGSLKDFVGDLIHDESIGDYFDKEIIKNTFDKHQKGDIHAHHSLWTVAMFQSWRKDKNR